MLLRSSPTIPPQAGASPVGPGPAGRPVDVGRVDAGRVDAGRVEAGLLAQLDRLPGPLAEPCRRIAAAGGKRLRARLALAAAAAVGGGAPPVRLVDAAVAVELLHLATLVHDDLLDEASTRRGVPTVNAREGAGTAVLVGDVLIGAAGRLAAGLGAEAGLLLQETLVELCVGQSLEAAVRYEAATPVETVLAVAEKKTGALLAAACQLGALAAAEQPAVQAVAALGGYGRAFGVCLQVLDDVLDVVSSEVRYGKPTGVDFAAGTVTLPAVRPLAESPELRALLRPGLRAEDRRRALDLLRTGGGVADAVDHALSCARQAGETLGAARLEGDARTRERLAALPLEHLDGQLALVLPEWRHLLASPTACSA